MQQESSRDMVDKKKDALRKKGRGKMLGEKARLSPLDDTRRGTPGRNRR
jgi:hypothetical protein